MISIFHLPQASCHMEDDSDVSDRRRRRRLVLRSRCCMRLLHTVLYSGPLLHDQPTALYCISAGAIKRELGTASFGSIQPSCPPTDWSITQYMHLYSINGSKALFFGVIYWIARTDLIKQIQILKQRKYIYAASQQLYILPQFQITSHFIFSLVTQFLLYILIDL